MPILLLGPLLSLFLWINITQSAATSSAYDLAGMPSPSSPAKEISFSEKKELSSFTEDLPSSIVFHFPITDVTQFGGQFPAFIHTLDRASCPSLQHHEPLRSAFFDTLFKNPFYGAPSLGYHEEAFVDFINKGRADQNAFDPHLRELCSKALWRLTDLIAQSEDQKRGVQALDEVAFYSILFTGHPLYQEEDGVLSDEQTVLSLQAIDHAEKFLPEDASDVLWLLSKRPGLRKNLTERSESAKRAVTSMYAQTLSELGEYPFETISAANEWLRVYYLNRCHPGNEVSHNLFAQHLIQPVGELLYRGSPELGKAFEMSQWPLIQDPKRRSLLGTAHLCSVARRSDDRLLLTEGYRIAQLNVSEFYPHFIQALTAKDFIKISNPHWVFLLLRRMSKEKPELTQALLERLKKNHWHTLALEPNDRIEYAYGSLQLALTKQDETSFYKQADTIISQNLIRKNDALYTLILNQLERSSANHINMQIDLLTKLANNGDLTAKILLASKFSGLNHNELSKNLLQQVAGDDENPFYQFKAKAMLALAEKAHVAYEELKKTHKEYTAKEDVQPFVDWCSLLLFNVAKEHQDAPEKEREEYISTALMSTDPLIRLKAIFTQLPFSKKSSENKLTSLLEEGKALLKQIPENWQYYLLKKEVRDLLANTQVSLAVVLGKKGNPNLAKKYIIDAVAEYSETQMLKNVVTEIIVTHLKDCEFEQALKFLSDYQAVQPFSKQVQTLKETSLSSAANFHKVVALLEYNRKNISKAIENLQTAIQLMPSNPELHIHLGQIYMNTGAPQKAEICFQFAYNLQSPQGCIELAELVLEGHSSTKTIEHAMQVFNLAENYALADGTELQKIEPALLVGRSICKLELDQELDDEEIKALRAVQDLRKNAILALIYKRRADACHDTIKKKINQNLAHGFFKLSFDKRSLTPREALALIETHHALPANREETEKLFYLCQDILKRTPGSNHYAEKLNAKMTELLQKIR